MLFQEYSELIGLDMGMDVRTNDDLIQIFQGLVERLKSTHTKLAPVKTSRWFSWHQACSDQLEEWWALRMLLVHTYPHEPPIDSCTKSFTSLRNENVGVKLALYCLTWRCWLSVNVLYLAGQPLWTWFSDLVRSVKTPDDGLKRTIWLAQNWRHDDQFRNLIQVFQELTLQGWNGIWSSQWLMWGQILPATWSHLWRSCSFMF